MADATELHETNDERADRAQPGLALYAEASYGNPKDEDAATHIGDMISALLHLAQREGCNPFAVMQAGIAHYCAERADPEDIGPDISVTIQVNGYDGSEILPLLDDAAAALEALDDSDGEDDLQLAFEAAVKKVENRT